MLDIKFIRAFPEKVKENIKLRRTKNADIDEIVRMDETRLDLLRQVETKRALRNSLTEAIKKADPDQKENFVKEATVLKSELKKLEDDLKIIEGALEEKMAYVPNMLAEDAPHGVGDDGHKELAVWLPGEGYLEKEKLGKGFNSTKHMPKPDFKGKDHVELGKKLGIIDVEQSAQVSGSRFCYLKGDAVLLQDAITHLLKKKLIAEGFVPMVTPLLVRERVLFGTSHFPEGRDQVYKIDTELVEDNAQLFLVGSSEPPLFAYHMDKVLEEKTLPYKMYALTSCFRSEVGSWGKDVRGIKRVHQFDKLEIDVVCTPEQSMEVMEYLRGINEWFYQTLELPYRIIYKCSGDCGYNASHKQYDVEVWLPHQGEFIEVASDTNTTDYQARRLNIKFKQGADLRYVHTVNDTGCPVGRVIIGILDNYQQPDGTIRVPAALREFMGKEVIS